MANKRKLMAKRNEKAITQENLAKAIGMSTKTYNHKENGKVDFNSAEISAIAKELNLSLKEVNEIFLKS